MILKRMVVPTPRWQRRAANATPSWLGAPFSWPCDGPYRWRTSAPPTPALAVGRNAFALASPEDSTRPPKLRLHAALATCSLASHLSPLVEYSSRSRGRRSLSLSTSGPMRAVHKREPITRRASVGLATLSSRAPGRRGSRKVRVGSRPARAGYPARRAPKRWGQSSACRPR